MGLRPFSSPFLWRDRSKPRDASVSIVRTDPLEEQRHAAPLTDARIVRNQPQAMHNGRRDDQLIRRVLVETRSLQRRDSLGR
jgi:hypothetical protein